MDIERIAIYSRKSKFTGKGESIDNQAELCREYIRDHFEKSAEIVVFEDEGFSGGNLNRPGFRKMMTAAHDHAFQAIIVYRLDRISRNISDFSGLIDELSRLGIAFISIREQFDTGTPMGRAMMYIASVFSQLERETIAERIRDNMLELAKTGRWLGGTTPTGYDSESMKWITIDGKAKRSCRLKLIPAEAEIVRLIFALFLETESLTRTETLLMQRGVRSKTGAYYTRFSIKSILRNPVYLVADAAAYDYFLEKDAELCAPSGAFDGSHGILPYNRTIQEKGRTTIYRPMNEWIIAVGQHTGLIPSCQWMAVQAVLDRNCSKAYRKPRKNEALLTGLLYCGCGSRMYPKLTKSGYAYLCKRKVESKRVLCHAENINGNVLDTAILEELKKLKEDRTIFTEQLKTGCALFGELHGVAENPLSALRKERREIKKKIAALVDRLSETGDSAAALYITERIEMLSEEIQKLDVRMQELPISQDVLSEAEAASILQKASDFSVCLENVAVVQKRAALRTLVQKVVWDGGAAHVYLFGAPEKMILSEDSK